MFLVSIHGGKTFFVTSLSADCDGPLGMQSGQIPNSALSASSEYTVNGLAYHGRLNTQTGYGCWYPTYNDAGQYIQVDFGKPTKVTKIGTQGRNNVNQYVTKYSVSYSLDNGVFESYKNQLYDTVMVSLRIVSRHFTLKNGSWSLSNPHECARIRNEIVYWHCAV